MPMNFPDMKSLQRAAELHKFREIQEGEGEEEYREALADHVVSRDPVESGEIRYGVGWDQWTDQQKRDHLIRIGLSEWV